MFISEIYASGFRCFGADNPLIINLEKGLNVLVGPNDAGKTAIIDAPRYVLWTRGDDYLRLEPSDFHVTPDGNLEKELLIRCTFDGLTSDEESRFLEWCNNENGTLRLHVCLRGALRKLQGGSYAPVTQYRAGKDADGLPLDGELREYLKATYLKPLRDAERELRAGRRSRLSRILGALPNMAMQSESAPTGQPPTLADTLRGADEGIEGNQAVQTIQGAVNDNYLNDLSFPDDRLTATLGLGVKGSFDQLLERLELYLNPSASHAERIARGLGYNNLLFMAAELLLLQSHPEQIPFLLIEEPEAHLHPQHQTLFMQILEDRSAPPAEENDNQQQVQVLLTTHSPHLAASANLESMIMVTEHKIYPLKSGQTKLDAEDYSFLRRFLDATKANMFFARGIIIVEGDAENILLPALAKKMGRPLSKHGVSIVNVGHRGLFRYSRILQRADDTEMPIPVALIPDRDIPPDIAKQLVGKKRKTENEWDATKKQEHLASLTKDEGEVVKAFPSEQWTLEFDLARQPDFAVLIHQAVLVAKGKVGKTREQLMQEARLQVEKRQADANKTADDIALLIYTPIHKKQVSKTVLAEQLARIVDELPDTAETFRAKLPQYLVNAINYATRLAPDETQIVAPPAEENTNDAATAP